MTYGSETSFAGDSWNYRTKSWSGTDGRWRENTYTADIYEVGSIAPAMEEYGYFSADFPYWRFTGYSWHTNMLPSTPVAYLQLSSNDDLRALSKLAEAIRGTDFNAGIFLAESKELVAGIVASSRAIFKALREVKRLRPDLALRALARVTQGISSKDFSDLKKLNRNDISGTWLALKFAWFPAIQDVYSACEALHTLDQERSWTFRSSSPARKDSYQITASGLKVERRTQVQYKFILKNPPTSWQSFGLMDPLPIIWEILPWSFVLDWFVPVGDFLSTSGLLTVLIGECSRTQFQQVYFRGSVPMYYASPTLRFSGGKWSVFNQIHVQRTVSTSPSVGFPEMKKLGAIASGSHLASAAALISQQIRLSR